MAVPSYEFEKFIVFAPAMCLTESISARQIIFERDAMLIFENEGLLREVTIECEEMLLAGDTNTIAGRCFLSLDGPHGNPGASGASFAGDIVETGRPGGHGVRGGKGEHAKQCDSISLRPTITKIVGLGTTKLRFDLRGPNGGNGGHGGAGGHGGHGQRGMPCELSDPEIEPVNCAVAQGPGGEGGNGGQGGNGGNAGNGGHGGNITFVVLQELADKMQQALRAGSLEILTAGGNPGQPGNPGRGGVGGWEGPVGLSLGQCNLIWSVASPVQARAGLAGHGGAVASHGNSGAVTWLTL
jgi:hypothetical protein